MPPCGLAAGHRTRPELAVEMLRILWEHGRLRRFHVVADSAYGGRSVLHQLPGELRSDEPFASRRPLVRSATENENPAPTVAHANAGHDFPRRADAGRSLSPGNSELYGRRDRVRLADQAGSLALRTGTVAEDRGGGAAVRRASRASVLLDRGLPRRRTSARLLCAPLGH